MKCGGANVPLPNPCEKCAPYSGNFVVVEFRNGRSGTRRCDCARGEALAAADVMRAQPPISDPEPRISNESATAGVSMLTALKFFPGEAAARMVIADELRCMCNDDGELFW